MEDLLQLFDQFGAIEKLKIEWNRHVKSWVVIVTYDDFKSAKKARDEYDGAELDDKKIRIRILRD